jgi:signal transduction histidine kinase
MMDFGRTGRRSWIGELGPWGALSIVGVAVLAAFVILVLPGLRPPTVEQIERDIWSDWARSATDQQGLTLVDQLLEGRRAGCQRLLEATGRLIEAEGERFIVRTGVRRIAILDRNGGTFAEWSSPTVDEGSLGFKEATVPLTDPSEGTVGTLVITYRFYSQGLESLPNVRRLRTAFLVAVGLVGLLTLLLLAALLANAARLRERAARMRSQQVTLDLAHQMCHEIRNGLWAFSLEGRNLSRHFDLMDEFLRRLSPAVEEAARSAGLDEPRIPKLLRRIERSLADGSVSPEVDVAPSARIARESQESITAFARYLNLTVEELDRYLLGLDNIARPEPLLVADVWREVRELIELRLRSAGVSALERIEAPLATIVADRRSLLHALLNLTKNGIEALRPLEPPRTLRFELTEGDGRVDITVGNSGPVIPPEVLARLFERGFSTKGGAGRGTGLTIVRESIERMGGLISVTSDAERGTSFRISVPGVAVRRIEEPGGAERDPPAA